MNLDAEIKEAKQNVFIRMMYEVDRGNNRLEGLLNDLRHQMNDDLIQLKYGNKNYPVSYNDPILIKW